MDKTALVVQHGIMPSVKTPFDLRPGGVVSEQIVHGNRPLLVIAAVTAALGVRFFFFIWKYSVNVLFSDQWDYLTPFFRHNPGFVELFFWQHGHRQGIGLFLDKFLYPWTRWNTRVDSFVIAGSIVAAMLLALSLKRKLFGPLSYFDVAIPFMFLTIAQYEIVISAPNPAAQAFPLLMIMLYCLALLLRRTFLRYSAVLLLNFLLIYTGYGLFMGVITLGVFALEYYWSLRGTSEVSGWLPVAGLAIAVACLGSFFVHFTFSPMVECFEIPRHHLLAYPWFVSLMFAAFVVPKAWLMPLTTAVGVAIVAGVLAMLVTDVHRLVKDRASSRACLIGAVLLSYCLLYSSSTAVGRVCLGLPTAFSSRYKTLLIPAFLAIYFHLLSRPWRGKRNLVLGLFVVLLIPSAVLEHRGIVHWLSDGKREWARCYLRTEDIRYCDQLTHFTVYPNPEGAGMQQKLEYLKQHQLNLFADPSLR